MISYGIGILSLIKNLKQEIPDVTQPCYIDDSGSLGTFCKNWDSFYFSNTPGSRAQKTSPNRQKSYWLCIWRISRTEDCLASVIGLRCERARVILGVRSGTTSPRAIGWESVRWRGRRTLTQSVNRREISPGELCRGGIRFPTGVDVSTTRHLGHGGCVCGSGEDDQGNLFASSFLQKEKSLSPIVVVLSKILVKKSRLGLLNPVMPENEKYLSSQRGSA